MGKIVHVGDDIYEEIGHEEGTTVKDSDEEDEFVEEDDLPEEDFEAQIPASFIALAVVAILIALMACLFQK